MRRWSGSTVMVAACGSTVKSPAVNPHSTGGRSGLGLSTAWWPAFSSAASLSNCSSNSENSTTGPNAAPGTVRAFIPKSGTISLDGHPDKLDDFEELLAGYGIVELQRTGRVALPKLDKEARLRAASHTKKSDYGKAG